MSLNARQILDIAAPKVVQCPEICDVKDTSYKVVSHTVMWQIYNTVSNYISPSFRFGGKNEHEAYIKAFTEKRADTQTRVTLHFMFVTPTDQLPPGKVTFTLSCSGGATVSEYFSSKSNQSLTFPEMLWSAVFDNANPYKIICVLKLKETTLIPAPKDHDLKLISDLTELYNSMSIPDVTIQVKGEKVLAHKAILAARSPVFTAMFQAEMAEKKTNVIAIEDTTLDAMKEFIQYIYTGKVPNLGEYGEELMTLADKYGVDELRQECGHFLAQHVVVENATRLLLLGDIHRHKDLWTNAVDFVKRNRMEVKDTEDWKRVKESDPKLLLEAFMEK